jgi:type VI secretion system protein ImpH
MSDLKKKILTEGYRFEFFQAVSLLEQAYPDRANIGYTGPFSEEIAQLLPNNSLGFPAGDISGVSLKQDDDDVVKWIIYENFLGLYGPNSAAPIFIAESVNQCTDDSDPLKDFLDIFNHRVISFFYRALKKSNILKTVSTTRNNPVSNILNAIMGRDFTGDETDWDVNPNKLLTHCSLFSSSNRNPGGLEKMLSSYFELSGIRVLPFARRRIKIPVDSRGRLSAIHNSAALGESLILGEIVEDISGQFFLRIKMPDMHTFKQFQPGEPKYKELIFLVNMYVQFRLGFSLQYVLPTEEVGSLTISSFDADGKLGQSAWVGSPKEKETTVTINVSEIL